MGLRPVIPDSRHRTPGWKYLAGERAKSALTLGKLPASGTIVPYGPGSHIDQPARKDCLAAFRCNAISRLAAFWKHRTAALANSRNDPAIRQSRSKTSHHPHSDGQRQKTAKFRVSDGFCANRGGSLFFRQARATRPGRCRDTARQADPPPPA